MPETKRKLTRQIKQRGKANGWTTWTEWIIGWMIQHGHTTVQTEDPQHKEWVRDLWREKVEHQ